MTDYGYSHRADLLLDTPANRHALKIKRAISFLGDRWLAHPSQRHTRQVHRAHVAGQHPFRFPQWTAP